MSVRLLPIIQKYINTSNKHDVKSILTCFSDDAVVHDEGKELHGKKAIEDWIRKTIDKYKFQFKPLSVKNEDTGVAVRVEVSGSFDGSPISLDYHFAIANDKILSLKIG